MMYRLRAALQGFCRRLSRFMARHFIDRESEWADAEELAGRRAAGKCLRLRNPAGIGWDIL